MRKMFNKEGLRILYYCGNTFKFQHKLVMHCLHVTCRRHVHDDCQRVRTWRHHDRVPYPTAADDYFVRSTVVRLADRSVQPTPTICYIPHTPSVERLPPAAAPWAVARRRRSCGAQVGRSAVDNATEIDEMYPDLLSALWYDVPRAALRAHSGQLCDVTADVVLVWRQTDVFVCRTVSRRIGFNYNHH